MCVFLQNRPNGLFFLLVLKMFNFLCLTTLFYVASYMLLI